MYGALPPGYGQVGQDVARVGLTTVGTGASIASGLIASAGGAALVPGVGWVVGGALALTAGAVSLVSAIAGGKVRKAEAVEIAREMGFPSPESVPGFVVRVLKWDEFKLRRRLRYWQRRRRGRNRDAKIALLQAAIKVQRQQRIEALAEERRDMGDLCGDGQPYGVLPALAAATLPEWAVPAAVVGGATLFLLVALRPRRRRA